MDSSEGNLRGEPVRWPGLKQDKKGRAGSAYRIPPSGQANPEIEAGKPLELGLHGGMDFEFPCDLKWGNDNDFRKIFPS